MKKVCLCGSFRFFKVMTEVEKFLTNKGVICFAPQPFEFRDPEQPAYFSKKWDELSYSTKLEVSRKAELSYLDKIDKADILFVINPSGYVGKSVLLEIGYALGKDKAVFLLEPIQDYAIAGLIQRIATPEALLRIIETE